MVEIAYVSEVANLDIVRKSLSSASVIGVDTETTGLDYLSDRVVLVQLAVMGKVFVLDLFKLPKPAVAELLEQVLHDRATTIVMHNAKFDTQFLQREFGFGLRIPNLFDTMLAHFLVHGGDKSFRQGLKSVCEELLGLPMDKEEQVSDWGSGNLYKEQIEYAGKDAYVLLKLYPILSDALKKNGLLKVAKLEFECIPAIAQMEMNGIGIDKGRWRDIALSQKDKIYEMEIAIKKRLGNEDINLNSHIQVRNALRELSGLDITSVSAEAIRDLIDNYESQVDLFGKERDIRPVLIEFQQYKNYAKLESSFGLKFLDHVHPKSGRIHPSFRQLYPNTGRLSCANPNMQQIPKTSEHRGAFVAREGYKLITKDYSQIELRILADLTGEETLVTAFTEGRDIHTEVASRITGKAVEDVSKKERDFAKIINYGTPYGMGAGRMAAVLNISVDRARKALDNYLTTHPKVAEWFKQQENYFKTYDCVRTASGRLRKLTGWQMSDELYHLSVQASKNFPIQGTNADIMKTALTELDSGLPSDAMLVNCVHDEVVVECKEEIADYVSKQVEELMIASGEKFVRSVPIQVDGSVSDRWSKE